MLVLSQVDCFAGPSDPDPFLPEEVDHDLSTLLLKQDVLRG